MDNPMTLHDELAGLAAKATPGPWGMRGLMVTGFDPDDPSSPWDVADFDLGAGHPHIQDGSNAALIVALRNNLPAILSALNAADEVKRLREALEQIADIEPDADNMQRFHDIANAALNQGPTQ